MLYNMEGLCANIFVHAVYVWSFTASTLRLESEVVSVTFVSNSTLTLLISTEDFSLDLTCFKLIHDRSFPILSNSVFTNRPSIRHDLVRDVDSQVK
jgi:hypothetical protein